MATNSTTSPLRQVETAIASHRLTSMNWRGKGIGVLRMFLEWYGLSMPGSSGNQTFRIIL